MRILITGDKGFVGTYLRQLLEEDGHMVAGYSYQSGHDLLDYEQLRRYLDQIRPDRIYHLAAQAYVPESFTSPQRAFEINTIGSLNLLEAVRKLGLQTRILLAGTSEEYGDAEPIENGFLNPQSPYAISKVAMGKLGLLYAKSYGLNVVVTRAFNHTGPGRGEMYAESSFAKQIAEIEVDLREELFHGNLTSLRNYTDVRDMVNAYVQAIELPSDVYNICSRRNVTIKEVLEILCNLANTPIALQQNTALIRPSDFSFKEPFCKKFTKFTSWKPHYMLEDTLADLLGYWRGQV